MRIFLIGFISDPPLSRAESVRLAIECDLCAVTEQTLPVGMLITTDIGLLEVTAHEHGGKIVHAEMVECFIEAKA